MADIFVSISDTSEKTCSLIIYVPMLPFYIGIAILVAALTIGVGQCRASSHLHADLLLNVLRSPGQFFDTTPFGRILNRFSKDIDVIDTMIPMNVRGFLMTCFHVISTVVVIAISTPLVLSILVPLGLLYYFIQVSMK